jgi:hypothetical protein
MLLFNLVASVAALTIVFWLFGDFHRLAQWSAERAGEQGGVAGWLSRAMGADSAPGGPRIPWLLALLPGAMVAYTGIWYWCACTGRSRGVPWSGALFYGFLAAVMDLPVGGFFIGAIRGGPALGLIFAVISIVLLPGVLPALAVFGLSMGGLNAFVAASWVEAHRPPSDDQ